MHVRIDVSKPLLLLLCAGTLGACAADVPDEPVINRFGTTRAETERTANGDVTTTLSRVADGAVLGAATWSPVDNTQVWTVDALSGENVIDHAPAAMEQALLLETAWINTPSGYSEWASQRTQRSFYYECTVSPFLGCQKADCLGGGFWCLTITCEDYGFGQCEPIYP